MGVAVAGAAAILVASPAAALGSSGPIWITSLGVNADRSISVGWNYPSNPRQGGAVVVDTGYWDDATGELLNQSGITVADAPIGGHQFGATTPPLNMTIQQPTTVYLQVQLYDPYGDGGCGQGPYGTDCDSYPMAITILPICSQVQISAGYYTPQLVKAAYLTKILIRHGHWLRRHGHYVHWHGFRVWVKPVYKRIYHPAVYTQVWTPPTYQTQCH